MKKMTVDNLLKVKMHSKGKILPFYQIRVVPVLYDLLPIMKATNNEKNEHIKYNIRKITLGFQ